MSDETGVTLAKEMSQNAYCPYSNFRVGAAILGENGQWYGGSNVENAAYPQSQCAEATAIGHMVSQGCTTIQTVHLYTPTEEFCWPCGACRQRLWEFASPDTRIVSHNNQGEQEHTMAELLPYSFDKHDLNKA